MMAGESNRSWEVATRHKIGRASNFIRQHQGVISPLRRLPSEILQEIFMKAGLERSKHSLSNRDVPWYLSQVCHRWRAISLLISALWSCLPTMVLKKGRRRAARQLAAVGELIKRAGNGPLTFCFLTRKYTSSSHPLLNLLMHHAERWQSATFQLPQNLLASLNCVMNRLPLLETVIIRARLINFAESPTVFDVFSIAPRLRTVTVSGFTPSIRIILPFPQLVNYTDRSSGTDLLSTIFQPSNCVSLETLSILEISEDTPFPAFTLPKLTKLVVREYNWHNVSYFCNLNLPSIEEIKFMSYGGQVLQTLIGLLSNNIEGAQNLQSLTFRCESAGDADAGLLTQLLTLVPNVTYLDASLPPHFDINNLVSGDAGHGNRMLVPLLEACKFYIPQDWNCTPQDVDALNALASARCGPEGTLVAPGVSSLSTSDSQDAPLPLLSGETRSLNTFLLYCDFTQGISAAKQHLNIGPQVPESDIPEWEALLALKEQLKEEMPDLLYIRPYKERTWNLMWKDRMMRIMDDLEQFELKNAQLIYHSDLPLIVRRMRDWSFKTLESTGLSRRAREILEKWDPILKRDLVPSLKWASKGTHSLVYLTKEDREFILGFANTEV
ncbi:hypothetical protein CPB83DRAFT_442577 [Crepidotus variabilis]|uniref:F-box domain-containing protein n=1 Tax=Crepidotus variabilis TaxID=179855 RepID=A0A9P6JNP7_9AGAR|nr:hypothetical protein CPB83DRAFT_442577 [Crepidotus variabilis]